MLAASRWPSSTRSMARARAGSDVIDTIALAVMRTMLPPSIVFPHFAAASLGIVLQAALQGAQSCTPAASPRTTEIMSASTRPSRSPFRLLGTVPRRHVPKNEFKHILAIADITDSTVVPTHTTLPSGEKTIVYYFADEATTSSSLSILPDVEPLFVSDSVDSWLQREQHLAHNGLMVKRPFNGIWDSYQAAVDEAEMRIGRGGGLSAVIELSSDTLRADVEASVAKLLAKAALPTPLSEQIRSDACSIGCAVGSMCASARALEVSLQIFGEKVCTKMHIDNVVGRALVSYTGAVGTEYTRDSNVDFDELEHCGNNDCILRDRDAVESIEVGSILFMKGSAYKGSRPLVHRSPVPRHHADGRVVNRLVLKVDVE